MDENYLSWHSTVRRNMTMDTLKAGDVKLLLLQCIETSEQHGGVLSQWLT
jgi:hypothetical protein